MREIAPKLFIGDETDCRFHSSDGWAIIHACKFPCHRNALGYKYKLPQSHPHYLIYETGENLYLNMVDMAQELRAEYTNPIMESAIKFITKYITTNKILIHCNQGLSRSPSIGLVYLARKKIINNENYENAYSNFKKVYPSYEPGNGIAMYLINNWNFLMNFS
ncbi:MAG: dual specificity protein phosphatase family protein [Bacteroidales bacterium]|nr:dual specificity protein phosphatase family protein [Bacteroidales bacterium]